jgi:exodeoxyribonuclease-3
MIKLATWNVNSLKVRLEQVLEWLEQSQTDILAIQETKLEDAAFPRHAFEEAGFDVLYRGQKTYNGVAWISRLEMSDPLDAFPGYMDEQKRVLAATVNDIRLINVYVPNGQSVDSDKYQYKLGWLEAMQEFIKQEMAKYSKIVVVGDFNIAPQDIDVHDPKQWEGSVLVSQPERLAFMKLLRQGLVDSLRAHHPQEAMYSWWDYRAAAFRRGLGLRIDHVLLSQELMADCVHSGIDINPRKHSRPSDHAPVWVTLNNL